MPPTPVRLDEERRNRANFRERRRITEMNGMFDVLLHLLPPSRFKVRLSRVQVLREATEYIDRLTKFLELPEYIAGDSKTAFPHVFDETRQSNKDAYRRVIKQEGAVQAYISRHELEPETPEPLEATVPVSSVIVTQPSLFVANNQSIYFANTPGFYIAYC